MGPISICEIVGKAEMVTVGKSKNELVVAMDMHGSLKELPTLRKLAEGLLLAGHQVHIISALGDHDPHEKDYRAEIASWGIPFSGVHFVRFSGTPFPNIAYQVGLLKIAVMRTIGATILFDDNPYICQAVKDAGMLACQLIGKDGV